jgi:chromosome segregation ATPase
MANEGNGHKEKDYSLEILNALLSLNREMSAFRNEVGMRLGRLEEHFNKMMGRLGQVEGRLTMVEARLVALEERGSHQDTVTAAARDDARDAKFKVRDLRQDLQRGNGHLAQLEERLKVLERLQRSRLV